MAWDRFRDRLTGLIRDYEGELAQVLEYTRDVPVYRRGANHNTEFPDLIHTQRCVTELYQKKRLMVNFGAGLEVYSPVSVDAFTLGLNIANTLRKDNPLDQGDLETLLHYSQGLSKLGMFRRGQGWVKMASKMPLDKYLSMMKDVGYSERRGFPISAHALSNASIGTKEFMRFTGKIKSLVQNRVSPSSYLSCIERAWRIDDPTLPEALMDFVEQELTVHKKPYMLTGMFDNLRGAMKKIGDGKVTDLMHHVFLKKIDSNYEPGFGIWRFLAPHVENVLMQNSSLSKLNDQSVKQLLGYTNIWLPASEDSSEGRSAMWDVSKKDTKSCVLEMTCDFIDDVYDIQDNLKVIPGLSERVLAIGCSYSKSGFPNGKMHGFVEGMAKVTRRLEKSGKITSMEKIVTNIEEMRFEGS